ncbi:hypothetical protein [Paraburkholderia acidiphila]|uniref:Regulatory helix-turn-helix protein, lysR family n=1 Tax=Paraburkholderia acidiphila TaxID=2571747 RepID=A0A7Z2GE34_9BURK|nr:hypothetical protein FAZ97_35135 [Paraburkholderia acidiphila]
MDKLDMMRIVVRIAEEGSFTGAASRLSIQIANTLRAVTQGVPRTVQDLEAHTCLQFLTSFFRTPRASTLTPRSRRSWITCARGCPTRLPQMRTR